MARSISRKQTNVLWACREIGEYPNGYAASVDLDNISVCVEPGDGKAYTLRLPRRLARLLAKRINQCLDATKERK